MNRKITALHMQKRNNQRVNVYLDGEFAFGLSRIVAAWLQVGQEISEDKISDLMVKDSREVAYQRALKFISFRPRSEAEVRKKLQKHDIPQENIDHVLERLTKNGLIDDKGFARVWVENRTEFRPRSRRALSYELRQHGINPQVIEQTLGPLDDEELAFQTAIKKAHKYKNLDWNSFRQKMYNHLSQRGFDYQTSTLAINRTWEKVHGTDRATEEHEEDEEVHR